MKPRLGTVVRSTDVGLIDRLVTSGLDWLVLDGEHASVGLPEMETMLRLAGHRIPCYARVRELDESLINHVLQSGVTGVIVPNVDSAEQAAESVRYVRVSRWPHARVVVQAESTEAVRNIDAIVQTEGVEWVLIGPNDLTRSLGISGQFEHPAYLAAVGAVEAACRAAGVPIGIFGLGPERVRPFADRGFDWLLTGIDRALQGLP